MRWILTSLFAATLLVVATTAGVAAAEKTISNPQAGSCEHTVQQVFKAAKADNFTEFLKWVHPELKSTERMKLSWKNYSWKSLVRRVGKICNGSNCSYVVTRVHDAGKFRKVFVKKNITPSYPCPMTCKKKGAAWWLVSISCI